MNKFDLNGLTPKIVSRVFKCYYCNGSGVFVNRDIDPPGRLRVCPLCNGYGKRRILLETIQNEIDKLVGLKETKDTLAAELRVVNNDIEELTTNLTAHMDLNSVGSLESSNGSKIHKSRKVYPKVTDRVSLVDWWEGGGRETIGDKMEEWSQNYKTSGIEPEVQVLALNKKLLGLMVRALADEAANKGLDLKDVMPPGLEYSAKTSLSVRKPTQRSRWDKHALSLLDVVKEHKKDE